MFDKNQRQRRREREYLGDTEAVWRIAVTNAVLSNTGDAAIYESIVDSLTRQFGERCSVMVFDSNASVTRLLYPSWQIYQQLTVSPPREPARLRTLLQRARHALVKQIVSKESWRRFLNLPIMSATELSSAYQAISSVDLIVSSGGTYLVDHYNFEARALELELAKALGKPVVLWTQSMGPFESDRAKTQITRIARSVEAVYFRDARSEAAWNAAVPARPRHAVVADSVFALEVEPTRRPPGFRAAISVRNWSRGVDSGEFSSTQYEQAMRAAVTTLSELGWSSTALSTCQGVPSYSFDDSKEASRIFSGLNIDVDGSFHSPRALLDQLAGFDLVVTTRMHLAILALISRVPVIAVAYEFKTLELFEGLGIGHLVRRIEEVTPKWMSDTVARVVEQPQSAVLPEETIVSLRKSARLPSVAASELVAG